MYNLNLTDVEIDLVKQCMENMPLHGTVQTLPAVLSAITSLLVKIEKVKEQSTPKKEQP